MIEFNGNTEPEDVDAIRKRALMAMVPNVSVNDTREIANLSERADALLSHSDGLSTDDLDDSVPESLRPDLESTVYEAFESRSKQTGLRGGVKGVPARLDVTMEGLESYGRGDAHVHFRESGGSSGRKDSNDRLRAAPVSETEGWVQAELECTREQLEMHVETYEEAMEEMERVNKELLTVKKELQS